jgi:hypothetical protein
MKALTVMDGLPPRIDPAAIDRDKITGPFT